ncbi:MAG: alpha/beta hydrolase [Phycicoccus sp.]
MPGQDATSTSTDDTSAGGTPGRRDLRRTFRRSTAAAVLTVLLGLVVLAGAAGWVHVSTRQEEVAFASGDLTLRGTLFRPRFDGDAPAIVMVHGSGQTSRKSMLANAWTFAALGYAVLVYDKRGVGASDGGPTEWELFDLDDLANDAAGAYDYLRSRPDVDRDRIGFLGANQGAWVVSLAANRVEEPAFLVMASASVATVAEDRLDGRRAQLLHLGYSEAEAARAVDLLRLDHQVTRTGQGHGRLVAAVDCARDAPWFEEIYPEGGVLPADDPHRRWERTVLDYDPRPQLATIESPVLWMFGELDRSSPVALSVPRVQEARRAGRPYEIIVVEGADHDLEIEGGNPLETIVTARIPLVWQTKTWLDRSSTPARS